MKIVTFESLIENYRNGQNIWRRTSIELFVKEIERLQSVIEAKEQTCTYSEEDYDTNCWECSNCEVVWFFSDGTPQKSVVYYCSKCGAKITEFVPYEKEMK